MKIQNIILILTNKHSTNTNTIFAFIRILYSECNTIAVFLHICARSTHTIFVFCARVVIIIMSHQDGVASNACVSRHRVVRFALAVVMMMMMMMMISDDDDAGTRARASVIMQGVTVHLRRAS